jgi:hypothetical protein
MKVLEKALAGLRLGNPQVHLNLALVPLLGEGAELPGSSDKGAQRRLARHADPATRKQLPRLSRMYAVLSRDGAVVSVGHRYRRIRRS